MPKFGIVNTPPNSENVGNQTQPPNLMQQAVNFGGSVIKHVSNGLRQVSPEIKESRLEICKGCEFFKSGENPSCNKCGCFLNIKTSWASEACPAGKWGTEAGENPPQTIPCGGCNKK